MTFELLFVAAAIFAILSVCALLERTLITPPAILTGSLLLPILVFGIELKFFTLVVLTGSAGGFSLAYYLVVGSEALRRPSSGMFADESRITDATRLVIFLLFLVAQAAFLVNLLRVLTTLGIDAYLSQSAKVIELTFGSSTLINYIFFINIATASAAAFIVGSTSSSKGMKIIWAISIVSLAFSGIKSTVIFGGAISVFAYVLGRQRIGLIAITAMGAIAAIGVVAMFAFVNLGLGVVPGTDAIAMVTPQLAALFEGYIQYNYLNLEKELFERTEFTWGKFTFFFLTKLFDPEVKGYFDVSAFLVIDKNYNMGTYLREYFVDFGVAGAFGVPMMLGAICGFVKSWFERTRAVAAAITLSVLSTACLFAFFGNQFIRLQFIFVIVVAVLIQAAASMLMSLRSQNVPA